MKILITGAAGQLGSELSEVLANGRSELGAIPACYAGAQVCSVDLPELDITDREATIRFVGEGRFDLILNCAAMTRVDACETEQDVAFRVNALGPRNIALAAEAASAKLVHVSTDYVFAGNETEPYAEWEPVSPQSIYGRSKALGEQYVRDFCSRYFIVRTAWLYGYRGGNFVRTILRLAAERDRITVVNDQRGNPTNAADLAHHILKLAAGEEYGVYHCTAAGECSWYDFASEIVRLSGINCEVVPVTTAEYNSPAKRPAYSALDNMMLRNTVGDEMRPWREALACFMETIARGEKEQPGSCGKGSK